MAFILIIAAVFVFLTPTDASAWGIGVHLQLGSTLLESLGQLPPALQLLLQENRLHFLYGCISADITLGKKYTHYLQHCHSWRMGRKILEAAKTDSEKACAYGYLAHLAADTIAHSYFVPFKMIRSFNTVFLKHTYWEVRVESCVDPHIWSLARQIARKNFDRNDAMMRGVLSDTIFSFNTNKRIFNSLLLLNRLQQWQKMIRSMSTGSSWKLPEEHLDEYLSMASEATFSIISQMEESPYWKADPTGETGLYPAKLIRKNLKSLWQSGKLAESELDSYLVELKPKFKSSIFQPERIFELLSEET